MQQKRKIYSYTTHEEVYEAAREKAFAEKKSLSEKIHLFLVAYISKSSAIKRSSQKNKAR